MHCVPHQPHPPPRGCAGRRHQSRPDGQCACIALGLRHCTGAPALHWLLHFIVLLGIALYFALQYVARHCTWGGQWCNALCVLHCIALQGIALKVGSSALHSVLWCIVSRCAMLHCMIFCKLPVLVCNSVQCCTARFIHCVLHYILMNRGKFVVCSTSVKQCR